MTHYFVFPNFNPVAFSLGPLQVHWYGLMYLLGFLMAWLLARYRVWRYHLDWSTEQISDLIFYTAMGVVIGGRLGYMLFYNTALFLQSPWTVFKLWEGGMSFHGGLLGVFVALYCFAKQTHKSFLNVADFLTPLVPLGLGAGRLGNFINGELWGRTTDVPWAIIFRHVDDTPRHPSELYELGLEGIVLFCIVWAYARKPRAPGRISAVFLMSYALCRIIAECFREPDIQLGYLMLNTLTMGQILSIPMFLVGLYLFLRRV